MVNMLSPKHVGTDLTTAYNILLQLSILTYGNMQVRPNKTINFEFPRNFRKRLFQNKFKLFLLHQFNKIWYWSTYIFRLLFGIVLLSSLALLALGTTYYFLISL